MEELLQEWFDGWERGDIIAFWTFILTAVGLIIAVVAASKKNKVSLKNIKGNGYNSNSSRNNEKHSTVSLSIELEPQLKQAFVEALLDKNALNLELEDKSRKLEEQLKLNDDLKREVDELIKQLREQNSPIKSRVANAIEKNQFEEAETILKTTQSDDLESAAQVYYERAKLAEFEMQYRDALKLYEKAISMNPTNWRYLHDGGRMAHRLGLHKLSIELLERAKDKVPDSQKSTLLGNLGESYRSFGIYRKAITYGKQALDLDIKNSVNQHPILTIRYNNLGLAFEEMSDLEKALYYYQRSVDAMGTPVRNDEPSFTVFNNIGNLYHRKENFDEAIKNYEKAIVIYNQMSDVETRKMQDRLGTLYNNVGFTWHQKGNYNLALQFYSAAIAKIETIYGSHYPGLASCYNNKGITLSRLNQFEVALANYVKALNLNRQFLSSEHPDIANVCDNIGHLYYLQGIYTKAYRYFAKSYEIWKTLRGIEHPNSKTTAKMLEATKQKLAEQQQEEGGTEKE